MRIRCQSCGSEFGSYHGSGCIATLLPTAILTAMLTGYFGRAHPWLTALAAIPTWVFLSWCVWEVPRWLTLVWCACRCCPACGAHKWGHPSYTGFE